MQFLVFCAAVIRAVDKHATLLRASIAHAGNDHRLGANEAPPAILSIFLGDQLTEVFEKIAKGGSGKAKKPGVLTVGVDTLPPLPKDAGDRNRTSPFAFTGNKFEFRAVGSSQSVAGPLVILNTIIADSLDYIATELEAAKAKTPAALGAALQKVIQKIMKDHGRIIFNGDNYTEAWQKEAAKRGLPNARNTADAIPAAQNAVNDEVLAKYNVLSNREFHSRNEIYLEKYVKDVMIEARLALEIAKTMIFPAAVEYQNRLARTSLALKSLDKKHCTTVLDELERAGGQAPGRDRSAAPGHRARGEGRRGQACAVLPRRNHAGDAGGARGGRPVGRHRGRRSVAVADLPGNAVHQVVRSGPASGVSASFRDGGSGRRPGRQETNHAAEETVHLDNAVLAPDRHTREIDLLGEISRLLDRSLDLREVAEPDAGSALDAHGPEACDA